MKNNEHKSISRRPVLLMAVALLAGAAVTELPAQTSLSVGNTPGYPGTTVSVPINVRRATNIVAAQFDVAFNSAKVAADAATLATAPGGHVIRSREIAPGVRRTLVYAYNNVVLQTNGFSARMPFQVPAEERIGSGPLVPQNVVLAKADATALAPVTLSPGSIFVRPANRLPDGTVQFFLPSDPDGRYIIQATTDFLSWVTLTNTVAFANFMDLLDADAANYPHRFYRSVTAEAAGQFGAATLNPDGSIHFQLTGLSGRSYVLQASANLRDWLNLRTNVAAGGAIDFNVPVEAGYPYRFFRVKSE